MRFDGPRLDELLTKIKRNAVMLGDEIPAVGMRPDGTYKTGCGGWIDSFWCGMLLLAYQRTGEPFYLEQAKRQQPFFERRAQNTPEINEAYHYLPLDHDTGFIFSLSQVALYKLTGDETARNIALKGAEVLAGRYNEKGRFLKAWDTFPWDTDPVLIEEKKGKVIIDSMMNIHLLFWAAAQTGETRYREIAEAHAATVEQYLYRHDGTIFHTYNFNHVTGEPIGGKTAQGYHDLSCWARGQSWGIYGFALTYGYTGNKTYLETAKECAAYFIDHVSEGCIPPWDFAAVENTFVPWDSSAACIAASGLLEIAKYSEGAEKAYFKTYAEKFLKNLHRLCGTTGIDSFQPLILHGCGCAPYSKGTEKNIQNEQIDVPMIFGDYFYLEALLKLENEELELFW